MDLDLNGRTVIVTGASGGLGRQIAHAYAREGADVVLTYRSAVDTAERIAKEIDGRTLVAPYELGDAGSARALVAAVLDWSGRVDVVVNNAVAYGPIGEVAFDAVEESSWVPALRANVEGALQLSRAVAGHFRERRFGRLVHISTTGVDNGMVGGEYYTTAKAALHGFSRSVAFALGGAGDILSNVVTPGLTLTDTNEHITTAYGDIYRQKAALGRLLTAAEVASAVVWLGSGANTGITGQVISVSGGE